MKTSPMLFAGLLSVLALTACQSRPAEPVANPAEDAAPAQATPPDASDTCGAKPLSWLVGQNRDRVPKPAAGRVVRVVCSTCMMTMDFNASRLNVIYEQKTGNVLRLTCG